MANSILTSHYSGTSNTILVSHGWPDGSSANSVLGSHDADYPASGDTTPDAFSFTDQTDVAVNTTRTSNTITVAGITAAASISITGGTYQIGAGSFTSASGTVTNGQTVTVRHTSSASNSTATNTVLTIGGVSDTFTSTTVAASGFSAVLNTSTGVMTITGTGFGTKSPAAPIWMETFESATIGDNPAQAGFDLWASGTPQVPVVTAGQGVGGGRSLRSSHTGTVDDFAHVEKLIADTDTLFMSSWNKLTASSSSGGLQLKSHRSGPRQSDTDAAANYATTPYAKGSLWFTSGVTWSEIQTEPNREGGSHPESASSVQTDPGGIGSGLQIYTESFFQMNTPNLYDGLYQVLVNGTQLYNQATRCFRESSAHHFGFASFAPGLTNSTWTFTRDLSRPYVDNTRMRVFLGNSATLAGCTGRFLLRPTTWVDGSIIATEGKNYPSGYNYLYAIDANGAQIPLNGSLNGFAYSTI